MLSLSIANNSNVLDITGNNDYVLVDVTGLEPVQSQINLTSIGLLPGSQYNSSKVGNRNIVITVKVAGVESGVEIARGSLYAFCVPGEEVRLHFTTPRNEQVYIDGFVENLECDLFSNNQMVQISILCPQPCFIAGHESVSYASSGIMIINLGTETGLRIQGTASSGTTTITNESNGSSMTLSLSSGGNLDIYSSPEKKYIKLNNKLVFPFANGIPSWVRLTPGENSIKTSLPTGTTFEYDVLALGI